MNPDEPTTGVLAEEEVELLLRMGLARRLAPYHSNPEHVAERVAALLLADIESIGLRVAVAWQGPRE